MVTNSLICDLKSKKVIRFARLKQVLSDLEKYSITLSDAEGKIEINLKSERLATLNFMAAFLEYLQKTDIEEVAKKKEAQTEKTPEKQEIFCPYCGKRILRTAKFCTFCGKSNNYGKEIQK